MNDVTVRQIAAEDKKWIVDLLTEWWSSPTVVSRGRRHHADKLPGFIAEQDNRPAGLVTYNIDGKNCEIVTMNSLVENIGIGSALVDSVRRAARRVECARLWLITTNDNTAAMRFYQKRGFILAAIYRNSVEQLRRLKPGIPNTGNDGIPIRDEIEFEFSL